MTFDAALDIAVGLMLLYLLLSLVCTVINEYISQIMGWRANTLASGIARLVDLPQLRQAFYDHGLVRFAAAASGTKHPSYLPSRTFATALIGSLDPTKPLPGFADVEAAIRGLPASGIRNTLLSHVSVAQGDLTRLRDELASGFDAAMDRLSGLYKRRLQMCSLIVATTLAVVVNADTCAVTSALWKDTALRGQMVAAAPALISVANSPPDIDRLADIQDRLRPLPLGWHQPAPRGFGWATKIIGLLLTGLAVSLGAPFWFDLLSRFVRLRATGAKPAAVP